MATTVYSDKKDDFREIQILNLLIDYEADINRLPYIWVRVFLSHPDFSHKSLDKITDMKVK